mmetsp:Transcript_8398/g.12423  ORF Transcript_8398/g.12423 Transcript_8398/m.12423 type:complete len:127 (-) Transcript_8398:21-401(-)|eukprot:CAMPEP_0117425254 /NCGR_PEP_ID=MMETSP0758-20121206/5557_1 /TAXON_ID=63605 /ORGANISM="Percolomonas cosmopolitus, Strain AE-1 (ATCC 50343)" /LENGTH=126 /DNA_ID=CAMNT_0005209617 /DNA_START=15 /DNA_END=395 /DNA_ORIENTATION=+
MVVDPETEMAYPEGGFKSFNEFYPFYLSQHRDGMCRLLHVIGTSLVILWTILCWTTNITKIFSELNFILVWVFGALPMGYGFAWVGHFVYEKNKPATFKAPGYSLMGDFVMWFHVITGQLKIKYEH